MTTYTTYTTYYISGYNKRQSGPEVWNLGKYNIDELQNITWQFVPKEHLQSPQFNFILKMINIFVLNLSPILHHRG